MQGFVHFCCENLWPETGTGGQWRSYRGFRRFNEPGAPELLGAPEPDHKKIKQENYRHTSEKKLTINRYTRDSCVHLNGQYIDQHDVSRLCI